ncbi:MAG: sigma-70 family RNA polymerase sigma factor [Bacteroidota bacterium]
MGKLTAPKHQKVKSLPEKSKFLSLNDKDTQNDLAVQNYPLSPKDYAHQSDPELIAYYRKSKDLRILEYLLNKYDRYLASIAISMVKNMEEVKDIKQEMFFKLKKELDKDQEKNKRPDNYFKKWLGRVTKNYIYDKYIRPNHPIATESLPEVVENTMAQLDLDMDFQHVRDCIEDLSPDQRTYIELRFFGNMQNREISKEMNWAPGKTRSLRDRALPKLRKALGDKGKELLNYFKDE